LEFHSGRKPAAWAVAAHFIGFVVAIDLDFFFEC
jgi:hypothetical protein